MVERAILRTVLYADIFSYPLTFSELHRYLIHPQPVDVDTLAYVLQTSAYLARCLEVCEGFITLRSRSELVALRQARQAHSNRLHYLAKAYAHRLASVPFVRMVALTGAVAMHNASHANDDIDFMLVTAADRVWLARGLAIVLVYWARARGVSLCPNYVVAENRLAQNRQDLYVAHEIAQMLPLYGQAVYQRLWQENAWVNTLLANSTPFTLSQEVATRRWKHAAERALKGGAGNRLEQWEYQRKRRKFQAHLTTAASSAEIDSQTVKGHFNDHGQRVLQAYQVRLEHFGC